MLCIDCHVNVRVDAHECFTEAIPNCLGNDAMAAEAPANDE